MEFLGKIFCVVFRKIFRISHNRISTNYSPSLSNIIKANED